MLSLFDFVIYLFKNNTYFNAQHDENNLMYSFINNTMSEKQHTFI